MPAGRKIQTFYDKGMLKDRLNHSYNSFLYTRGKTLIMKSVKKDNKMCSVGICSVTEAIGLLGGGSLPKNTRRVCAATLTLIFKPPVTEWPPFIFHILLSPNDSHFQNASHLMTPEWLHFKK